MGQFNHVNLWEIDYKHAIRILTLIIYMSLHYSEPISG